MDLIAVSQLPNYCFEAQLFGITTKVSSNDSNLIISHLIDFENVRLRLIVALVGSKPKAKIAIVLVTVMAILMSILMDGTMTRNSNFQSSQQEISRFSTETKSKYSIHKLNMQKKMAMMNTKKTFSTSQRGTSTLSQD